MISMAEKLAFLDFIFEHKVINVDEYRILLMSTDKWGSDHALTLANEIGAVIDGTYLQMETVDNDISSSSDAS